MFLRYSLSFPSPLAQNEAQGKPKRRNVALITTKKLI